MNRQDLLTVYVGLFASSVVMSNAVSAALLQVGPFTLVAGALLYPVTFLLTDTISEVYGKAAATRAVWTGFAAQALAVAFIQFAAIWPAMDPEVGEAWRATFLPLWRIALASMVAYLVAQLIDVRVFHAIKARTGGRWLWLRNNVSTIVSQGVDTAIFVLVAFAGVLPWSVVGTIFLGQYAAKALIAAADTPFCYALVAFTNRFKDPGA